jgi:hypothetical protein
MIKSAFTTVLLINTVEYLKTNVAKRMIFTVPTIQRTSVHIFILRSFRTSDLLSSSPEAWIARKPSTTVRMKASTAVLV